MEITIRVAETDNATDRVPGVADPNLTESAWQRAKVDAAGVYRTTTFQLGGALMTAIFSALALIAQEGQPTTTQIAVPILAAAVAILLSVVIVFACQLAAAPVRQRNELRGAWESPAIETVNVEISLRNAHRKGDELLTQFGAGRGYTTSQRKEAEAWADGAISLMASRVPEEMSRRFLAAGEGQGVPQRLRARVESLQAIIAELHPQG